VGVPESERTPTTGRKIHSLSDKPDDPELLGRFKNIRIITEKRGSTRSPWISLRRSRNEQADQAQFLALAGPHRLGIEQSASAPCPALICTP
jgi:hypothetical protein